jgi:hypothetical protein
VSGIGNHTIPRVIDVGVKFGYLLVITISVYEGLIELGQRRMTNLMLWAFITPLLLQALSIVFRVVKASEADGSLSYIGGYGHEAAFSVVLATGLFIACFATGLKIWSRLTFVLVFMGAIIAANYRTAILAFAPLIVTQFNIDLIGRFSPKQRSIIAVGFLIVSAIAVVGIGWVFRERFLDIVTVVESFDELIKPQAEYTQDQKQLMSARPYIWAGYIEAYVNGSTLNHVLGYGPDSWIGVMNVYAHNTLVSALYEYGVFGIVAFCYLWATMLYAAMRTPRGVRGKLVAAHLSFLLLNMATMPHWMLEGDIFYGVICGYTLFMLLRPPSETGAGLPAERQPGERKPGPAKRPHMLKPRPNILRAD